MRSFPLRSITVSDFRRLEGTWRVPLDAPIVLIHGPNGSGKTSLLSAIELGLTGNVRSMRRHDDRYTAHLPTHGHDFATIEMEIADQEGSEHRPGRMTVGGDRIEGAPALAGDLARFYAERSYLDQVSLGQLLELYQYREGKEESALARFVNELLGLDQLDALQTGLSDTTHVARLRKLCGGFATLEADGARAEEELSTASSELAAADAALSGLLRQLEELAAGLPTPPLRIDGEDRRFISAVSEVVETTDDEQRRVELSELSQSMARIGGQIQSLRARPSSALLDEARAASESAKDAYGAWSDRYAGAIASLQTDASAAEVEGDESLEERLVAGLEAVDSRVANHLAAESEAGSASIQVTDLRSRAEELEAQLADAERSAGSLASGLAALREFVSDDLCPVCDRDFSEVGAGHLAGHVERKIEAITAQGRELDLIRRERQTVAADLAAAESRLASLQARILPVDALGSLQERRELLNSLQTRLGDLSGPIVQGRELRTAMENAAMRVDEAEASLVEESAVREELKAVALVLDQEAPSPGTSLDQSWGHLGEVLSRLQLSLDDRLAAYRNIQELIAAIKSRQSEVDELTQGVSASASRKSVLDDRLKEAKRRRAVARRVHDAAVEARGEIVQRVFTESLNDVWADVFTRLAPNEPFVPAFGIPHSTKSALELQLETQHPSGEPGGPPSLMLSSGNLNTAALSLFVALHLAVEPLVPCLVFDDPVQSMDEVHIAQLAGLLRVLSKHHERQIVVAVHERELFDYLVLELSPAFEGDELLTIELGPDRGLGSDDRVRRIEWIPDAAVAV